MSLHHLAQNIAAQGRGPDTQLVHMTANEVAGLQRLARAKGGSLTINPVTGLPEAGFLDDVGDAIGSVWDAGSSVVKGAGDIVQDITSSPLGSMLVGAALVAAGVPPQFAGLATGAASYASGNSFRQAVGSGLAGQGGGSLTESAGFADSLSPSSATPSTELGGAVPAAVPGAPVATPVADPTVLQAQPVPPLEVTTPAPTPVPVEATAAPAATTAQPTGAQAINAATHPDMSYAPVGSTQAATTSTAPTGFMDTLQGYYDKAGQWVVDNPKTALAGAAGLGALVGANAVPKQPASPQASNPYEGAYIRPFIYDQKTGGLRQLAPVKAPVKAATGGIMAGGGPIEQMSNANAVGQNTGYPQADIQGHAYATPWQTPVSENIVTGSADTGVNRMTGEMNFAMGGGVYDLGGYSDGGRLLKGPGDGVSDSIPATIGGKQPARLADGEFVVPARIVSELGNGSTDAGARQLYKMMDRIQAARGKTVGKNKVAADTRAAKHLPA